MVTTEALSLACLEAYWVLYKQLEIISLNIQEQQGNVDVDDFDIIVWIL